MRVLMWALGLTLAGWLQPAGLCAEPMPQPAQCAADCADWQRWRQALRQLQGAGDAAACPPCARMPAALSELQAQLQQAIAARQRQAAVRIAQREAERATERAVRDGAKRQRSSKR